jgi:hypothetical protein
MTQSRDSSNPGIVSRSCQSALNARVDVARDVVLK